MSTTAFSCQKTLFPDEIPDQNTRQYKKDNKDNTSTFVFTRVYDEGVYMISTHYIDQYK